MQRALLAASLVTIAQPPRRARSLSRFQQKATRADVARPHLKPIRLIGHLVRFLKSPLCRPARRMRVFRADRVNGVCVSCSLPTR
jgi:hypothetical protein